MDSSLVLAVAGGVGAFAGAVAGQVIQFARDLVSSRKADRHRLEDVRRDVYVEAIRLLSPLKQAANRLEFPLRLMASGQGISELDEIARKEWGVVSALIRDELPLVELSLVKASDEVLAALRSISRNSFFWEGHDPTHDVRIDPDELTLALASGEVEDIHAAFAHTRPATPAEIAARRLSAASGLRIQIATLIQLMRKESGLSSASKPVDLDDELESEGKFKRIRTRVHFRIGVLRARRRQRGVDRRSI